MLKKLSILVVAASAIVAMAVPAVAQAEAIRTANAWHLLLEEGTLLKATSYDWRWQTGGFGSARCVEIAYEGEITSNGERVELEEVQSSATSCSTTVHVQLGALNLDHPGTEELVGSWPEFGFDWFGGSCRSVNPVAFSYEYGSDDLEVAGEYSASPGGCGPVGFFGTFNLELAAGGQVEITES